VTPTNRETASIKVRSWFPSSSSHKSAAVIRIAHTCTARPSWCGPFERGCPRKGDPYDHGFWTIVPRLDRSLLQRRLLLYDSLKNWPRKSASEDEEDRRTSGPATDDKSVHASLLRSRDKCRLPALPHQQPLALPLAKREGFRGRQLGFAHPTGEAHILYQAKK
jgi:predicted RNA polymerase sigma factor